MTARSRRCLIVLAFVVAVLVAGYLLRSIINPLLVALLLAYILDPLVTSLERRGVPRKTTVVGIYAIGLLCVVLFGGMIVGKVLGGSVTLYDDFRRPGGRLDQFQDFLAESEWRAYLGLEDEADEETPPPDGDSGEAGGEAPDETSDDEPDGAAEDGPEEPTGGTEGAPATDSGGAEPGAEPDPEPVPEPVAEGTEPRTGFDLRSFIQQIRQMGEQSDGRVQSVARGVFQKTAAGFAGLFLILSYLVLVPIYCFFLMLSLDKIRKGIADHLPGTYRDRILEVLAKIDRSVSAFFRGRLLICFLKGAFISVGLSICGVSFAWPIGFLAGIGTLIPLLGGLIAFVPSVILAITEGGGPQMGQIVGIVAVVLGSEALEGFVLTPVILSKETGLHPLTLILAIFIAGEVLGFFGVLLAVPIASIVKILFGQFVLPEIRALAKEKPEPTSDTT